MPPVMQKQGRRPDRWPGSLGPPSLGPPSLGPPVSSGAAKLCHPQSSGQGPVGAAGWGHSPVRLQQGRPGSPNQCHPSVKNATKMVPTPRWCHPRVRRKHSDVRCHPSISPNQCHPPVFRGSCCLGPPPIHAAEAASQDGATRRFGEPPSWCHPPVRRGQLVPPVGSSTADSAGKLETVPVEPTSATRQYGRGQLVPPANWCHPSRRRQRAGLCHPSIREAQAASRDGATRQFGRGQLVRPVGSSPVGSSPAEPQTVPPVSSDRRQSGATPRFGGDRCKLGATPQSGSGSGVVAPDLSAQSCSRSPALVASRASLTAADCARWRP